MNLPPISKEEIENGRVIDIAEFKRKKAGPKDEKPRTYVKAVSATELELQIVNTVGEVFAGVMTPKSAEAFSSMFSRAVRDAWRLEQPKCQTCEEHACRKWHVGQRYERHAWAGMVRYAIQIVVERECKTSWRVRDISSGKRFYVTGTAGCPWKQVEGPR